MFTVRKKNHSPIFLITVFVFAQLAWMGLLGLWIHWYVTNYLIFVKVGEKLAPQMVIDSPNVVIFVGGILLIVGIATIMSLIFRNLTVQMKLTRLYDNFIANITHELKSPLSSLQLYLDTFRTKEISYEKKQEFLKLMLKDAYRLNKLIDSILEISRLEQKRIAHDYHVHRADDIIRKIIDNSIERFRLPKSVVKITGKAEFDCLIDKEAIQIVFDNLTDNAIKYSSNSVEIEVNLSANPKNIIIEFSDIGIGIASRDQKKIFNKFQRLENRLMPSVKGTGLGLYRVRQIIKYHKGKISVFSEGENKGTSFRIELPVYKPTRKKYLESLSGRNKNKTVLADGN
jgi:signal transduction histidine kinase